MYAFKNGVTPLNESTMNPLINLQSFIITYEGVLWYSVTGAGVAENSLADYNHIMRGRTLGGTVNRIELHLDRDGNGADLVVQIRDNTFNPDGSNDGVLLREILIPKEFIPLSAAYVSIPINLLDLSESYYWILAKRAGDATNKIDWIGETSQNPDYPAYRRAGESGAWTQINALHWKNYLGYSGLPRHVQEGTNSLTTIDYDGGLPKTIYLYIPPSDGAAGGIRDKMTLTYSNGMLTKGDV